MAQLRSPNRRAGSRAPRFLILGLPASVLSILAINTGIELVLFGADMRFWGGAAWRNWAYGHGAFWAPLLRGAEPLYPGQTALMFVSYAFLHGGWLHLTVNMIALASFGTEIVWRIGQKRFLIAYLISTLGGAAGFGLLSSAAIPMVGASGALFGLLGIWVCWDYLDRRFYGDPVWVTARALLFLLLYNVVFFLLLQGNLAWETHLGGFVAGWFLAAFWGRRVLAQSRRRRYGRTGQSTARGNPGREPR